MFEQYAAVLQEDMPSLLVQGEIYPASKLARVLSNIVFLLRFAVVGLIIGGPGSLEAIGIAQRPSWFLWMCENRVNQKKINYTVLDNNCY